MKLTEWKAEKATGAVSAVASVAVASAAASVAAGGFCPGTGVCWPWPGVPWKARKGASRGPGSRQRNEEQSLLARRHSSLLRVLPVQRNVQGRDSREEAPLSIQDNA